MTQGIRRNAAALLALSPGLLMLGCAVSSKDADPVAETTVRLGSGGAGSGGVGTGGTGTVGGNGASGGAGGSGGTGGSNDAGSDADADAGEAGAGGSGNSGGFGNSGGSGGSGGFGNSGGSGNSGGGGSSGTGGTATGGSGGSGVGGSGGFGAGGSGGFGAGGSGGFGAGGSGGFGAGGSGGFGAGGSGGFGAGGSGGFGAGGSGGSGVGGSGGFGAGGGGGFGAIGGGGFGAGGFGAGGSGATGGAATGGTGATSSGGASSGGSAGKGGAGGNPGGSGGVAGASGSGGYAGYAGYGGSGGYAGAGGAGGGVLDPPPFPEPPDPPEDPQCTEPPPGNPPEHDSLEINLAGSTKMVCPPSLLEFLKNPGGDTIYENPYYFGEWSEKPDALSAALFLRSEVSTSDENCVSSFDGKGEGEFKLNVCGRTLEVDSSVQASTQTIRCKECSEPPQLSCGDVSCSSKRLGGSGAASRGWAFAGTYPKGPSRFRLEYNGSIKVGGNGQLNYSTDKGNDAASCDDCDDCTSTQGKLGVHAGFSLGGGIDVPGISGSATASCTYALGYVFRKTSGQCQKPFCQGVQLDGECCLEANIYFGAKWFQIGKRWKKCIEATLAGPACMKN